MPGRGFRSAGLWIVAAAGLFAFGACSGQPADCDSCSDGDAPGGDNGCAGCDGDSGSGGGGNDADSGSGGSGAPLPTGPCSTPEVRITEVDLREIVDVNEDEVALRPLALSPKPGGGSRLAYMGGDDRVHVAELDASDQLVGTPISFPAHDFQDVLADDAGGVLLLTRDAEGGGTLNCGTPSNLCGTPPSPAVPCHDMYMVRFDGADESWATKLTSSSAALPPYSTGKTGPAVYMIWWYAHHGRLATDGTHFAAYYGAAISVSEGGCINIHQGDRMNVLGPNGNDADSEDAFGWGCSHSGYEHVIWDADNDRFTAICKTDNQNRLAFAPNYQTIRPVDLAYANPSDHATDGQGGYWLLTSDAQAGQPVMADGLAELHLLHFTDGEAEQNTVIAGGPSENARAPHLASYGEENLVAIWETSAESGDLRGQEDRAMHLQVRSRADGSAVSDVLPVSLRGNRYQALRSYPDGSVAYPAPGSSNTQVKILRVLACQE